MNLLLLYLAILPSVILGLYIYQKDIVEKEPISLLLRSFIGGIVAGILAIILSIFINVNNYPKDTLLHTLIYSFIFVSLIEEGVKFLLTYLICYKNKEFNYQYDGIVYSAFVALGFATYENILFVFQYGDIETAIYRGILTVPAHVFFAIFMGSYLGLAKHYRRYHSFKKERYALFQAFVIPVALHGFFDYCLFSESRIGYSFFFLFIIVLYISAFRKVKQISEEKKHI